MSFLSRFGCVMLRLGPSRSSVPLLTRCVASGWNINSRKNYSTSDELIGFIGLGNMGAPMANNLMQKGYKLVVYDLVESAVQAAISAGASQASSPAEVAAQSKKIITVLPAGKHVLECYHGDNGIFKSVQQSSLLVDCSTIDQETVKVISAAAKELDTRYLDAPISGGVGGATKGTLAFMVGGAEDSYHEIKPVLDCMGRAAVYCGGHGSGLAAKLCNNMVLGISMIGVSEALQLGINLGVDPKLLSEIINIASGRCWSSDTYNPCPGVMEGVPSSNNYQGGFGTSLMSKDLGLAMDASASTKSVTPMGALANQIYQLLCEQGHAEKDFSYVFKFIEKHEKSQKQ